MNYGLFAGYTMLCLSVTVITLLQQNDPGDSSTMHKKALKMDAITKITYLLSFALMALAIIVSKQVRLEMKIDSNIPQQEEIEDLD